MRMEECSCCLEDQQRYSLLISYQFPNTTVMFADIAGFTAWSAHREPTQVFKLLEILYGAFDRLVWHVLIFGLS